MTYHSLRHDTGGTSESRANEAFDILVNMKLHACSEMMTEREREFVEQTTDRVVQFGDRCMISPKQLFWLRDLKEKYL